MLELRKLGTVKIVIPRCLHKAESSEKNLCIQKQTVEINKIM